jgi:polar amino acid transport system permease protein
VDEGRQLNRRTRSSESPGASSAASLLSAETPIKGIRRRRGLEERLLLGWAPTALAAGIVAWVLSHIKWEFVASLDFAALWPYRFAIAQGVVDTLLLTLLSVALGLVAGTALAAGMQVRFRPMRWVIAAYLEVFRNTPLILQLFWIHFALPRLTGISTTPFQSGFIVMALQSSAYIADVARAGIEAVPRGQWEAAAALGLTRRVAWFDIVLPQAFKIIIPPLANIAIGYFKSSAMLSLLSVGELMTIATRIAQHSFKPIETYTLIGAVYLVLGASLSALTFRLERFYGGSGLRR